MPRRSATGKLVIVMPCLDAAAVPEWHGIDKSPSPVRIGSDLTDMAAVRWRRHPMWMVDWIARIT
jgi:hypothetical protein